MSCAYANFLQYSMLLEILDDYVPEFSIIVHNVSSVL